MYILSEEIENFLIKNSILRHVNLDETILVALKNLKETCNKTEWRSCLGDCFILVNTYIQEEIHSTHYILNCIANSVYGQTQYQRKNVKYIS